MALQITSVDHNTVTCTKGQLVFRYKITQYNGQKFLHLDTQCPNNFDMKAEVFVSDLPRNIAIHELLKFFSRVGNVYILRLLMDFSGSNRGICYVQYETVLQSCEAICCLNDEAIYGEHFIKVKMSFNNRQLILKSIPEWAHENLLKQMLKEYIGYGLKSISLKHGRFPSKNYCFCTYISHWYAAMAHKKAWPYINLHGTMIDVHWAVPNIIKNSVNLYFTGYPPDMTKKELYDELIKWVEPKLIVHMHFSQVSGYITFENYNSFVSQHSKIQDLVIRGHVLKFSRSPFTTNDDDEQEISDERSTSRTTFTNHRLPNYSPDRCEQVTPYVENSTLQFYQQSTMLTYPNNPQMSSVNVHRCTYGFHNMTYIPPSIPFSNHQAAHPRPYFVVNCRPESYY